MITVSNIRLDINRPESRAIDKALKILHLPRNKAGRAHIYKVSVDARKGRVSFVYSVAVSLEAGEEKAFENRGPDIQVRPKKEIEFLSGEKTLQAPPVICGFGPRGMMCALSLAKMGFKPIVIEQGGDVDSRIKAVENFNKTGVLNPRSNIQFGEGGRGTFSDGKLVTRISDERCAFVTDTFIRHGAPGEIAFKAKPHVGTDLLTGVVKSIRQEIISLGGQVMFDTKLTDIVVKNGHVRAVDTTAGVIPAGLLVIAAGHSARDLFSLLKEKGADMQAKPFSVGLRIEHLQSDIDKSLYHRLAGDNRLPPGEYNLSYTKGDRGVYTFCMCPGGYLAAASSEEGGVVTNGMSYHARDGRNANSAVVVSVLRSDFGGDFTKAIAFQREMERRAFAAAGKNYMAPRQTVDRFMAGKAGMNPGRVEPTYPIGVKEADFGDILPGFVYEGIRQALPVFDRKINGFAAPDSVLTGVESRTSSPVRIVRGDDMQSNIKGIYPAGEGAGYAGGIMSAAVDGVRVAQSICRQYKRQD